jgi:hypothetical protein
MEDRRDDEKADGVQQHSPIAFVAGKRSTSRHDELSTTPSGFSSHAFLDRLVPMCPARMHEVMPHVLHFFCRSGERPHQLVALQLAFG